MYSFILFILSIKLCDCLNKEICQLLRPNGVFDGVNAYTLYKERQLSPTDDKHWTGNYEYSVEHWMYKNGLEWRFKIHFDQKWIEFKDKTMRRIGDDMTPVILQFSTLVGKSEKEGVLKKRIVDSCHVIVKSNNKTELHCNRGLSNQKSLWKEANIQFDSSLSVAFNPSAGETNEYIILMSKTNRKRIQFYSIMKRQLFNENDVDCKGCVVPKFVQQINSKWIIDAIVDYGWDEHEKGYLIFLNIDNNPKYCLTPKGKELSVNCRAKNLMPYGFDCDSKDMRNSRYSDDKSKENDPFPLFWIIIIVFVIILIIIAILMAAIFRIRKYKKVSHEMHKMASDESLTSTESVDYGISKFVKTNQLSTTQTQTSSQKTNDSEDKPSTVKSKSKTGDNVNKTLNPESKVSSTSDASKN